MRRLLTVVLLLLALAPAALAAQAPARAESLPAEFADFDQFTEANMATWKVPGLAIAVIKDGKVILSKGYGYRDLENQKPVTTRTLFAIGSISKSFTATALGMLNDEGRLDWDAPVRRYLPGFRLYDETASQQATARDLLSHRTGLPRHDLLWYATGFGRKRLFDRLRYLEPNKPFRNTWQYQNLMFMTAGYLAGQITEKTWETVVRERIFVPLGMARTNFSVDTSQTGDDFALPYGITGGKPARIPFRNLDPLGPAGSINSSVEEMTTYLLFHMNRGQHGDKQLLSEKNAREMQTPQMVLPGTPDYEELGHDSYGLALFITTYRGHKLVWHSGSIDGFRAWMGFLPGKQSGVVMLTNQRDAGRFFREATAYGVFDRLLGLEPVEWSSRFQEEREKGRERQAKAREKNAAERKQGTSLSHALSDYAGSFEHPAYGVAKVSLQKDSLQAQFAGFTVPLEHYHYDIFQVPTNLSAPLSNFGGLKVQFLYNKKGEIDRVAIPLESSIADIIFTRIKPQEEAAAGSPDH